RPRPTPEVLPLVGGHSALDQFDSGESVLRVLASRVGATPRTLYAPAMLESATAVATLRGESSIGEVLAAAARVELALVGIGWRCGRALHRRPGGAAGRADGSARARGDLLRAAADPGGGGRRGRRGESTGRARRAAQRGDRHPGGGRRSGARGARGRLIRRPD